MSGYVYLIGSHVFSWYKIGKSAIPDVRVKQLGVLLPFKIEVVALWKVENHTLLESLLHEKYASQRINGEWFRFSEKHICSLLASMPQSVGATTVLFTNLESDARKGCKLRVRLIPDGSVKPRGIEARLKNLLADNKSLRDQVQILKEKLLGDRISQEVVPTSVKR